MTHTRRADGGAERAPKCSADALARDAPDRRVGGSDEASFWRAVGIATLESRYAPIADSEWSGKQKREICRRDYVRIRVLRWSYGIHIRQGERWLHSGWA